VPCPTQLSLFLEVVVALAAVAGVLLAFLALRTWKQEMRGRGEYELARKILTSAKKVQRSIAYVRGAMMHPGEWVDRPGEVITDPDLARWENTRYAYEKRMERPITELQELELLGVEAEALWDDLLGQPVEDMAQCVRDLAGAIRRHLRYTFPNTEYSYTDEQIEAFEAILWEDAEETDRFARRVDSVVAEFEEAMRPYIGHRPSGMKRGS
jgi:hypothetical protein